MYIQQRSDSVPIGRGDATVVAPADTVAIALGQLADLSYRVSPAPDEQIVRILTLVADALGVDLLILNRVDGPKLTIECLHNRADVGLKAGVAIDLCETYCTTMLSAHLRSLVIEDTRAHPTFHGLPATRDLGVAAYTGVPLHRGDGRLYGTLCTMHVHARTVPPGEVAVLALAGQLIMHAIDLRDLMSSEQLFRTLSEQATDVIRILNPDLTVRYASPSHLPVLGYLPAEIEGHHVFEFVHPDDLQAVEEHDADLERHANAVGRVEYRHRHADGSWRVLDLVIRNLLHLPSVQGYVSHSRDVTERRLMHEMLEHQATHDGLTDLPNRVLLHERLRQAFPTVERADAGVALLLLDLDRFKDVNDTLGHHYGDQLLQQVATRVQRVLPPDTTLARLGGDEFAVVLPAADEATACQTARMIHDTLADPFAVDGQRLDARVSIGIALYPAHGTDADTLLRCADVAMYSAKRSGTSDGFAIYDAAHDRHSPTMLALRGDLRDAIGTDALQLHFQPQIALNSGHVCVVEVLLRWLHPRQGLIMPDRFIPLAEQTGLIVPLTLWTLGEALRHCGSWDPDTRPGIAVNLSARVLHEPDLPRQVETLLTSSGVRPHELTLEVTEGMLMTDSTRGMAALTRLAAKGIRVSIDDFGTGYSSLAYLKSLPVDELKIDKSFVLDMVHDESDAMIVASTIALAHGLGLRVIAEGVENRATWRLLQKLDCDIVQGYYMSRPVEARNLKPWLSGLPWDGWDSTPPAADR